MRRRLRFGALAAPALCLLAAPAQSQEGAAGGATIDEVVVTAQRRSESIQDVPIAITAVGEQTLRDSNVKGIEDYFALTPNVSFRSDGSRDRKDLSMRGISNQLNQYANVRPATYAFYIDEFNVVAGTSNPQIVDLERIEVLRGPQGTYFGRNAVGGAINVITKKPGQRVVRRSRSRLQQPRHAWRACRRQHSRDQRRLRVARFRPDRGFGRLDREHQSGRRRQ